MVVVDLVSVSARPDRHYFLTSNTTNPVLDRLSLQTPFHDLPTLSQVPVPILSTVVMVEYDLYKENK